MAYFGVFGRSLTVLYLLFFFFYPFYLEFNLSSLRINPERILLVLLFIVVAMELLARIARGTAVFKSRYERWAVFFLLAYFLVQLLSNIVNNVEIRSLQLLINGFFSQVIVFLSALLFFYRDSRDRRLALLVIGIGVIGCSLYAIIEFIIEYNPLARLANPETNAGYIASMDFYRDETYRSKSTFEHPLTYAQVLAISFFSIFSIAKHTSYRVVLFFLLSFGAYASQSRSILVALFICFLAYGVMWLVVHVKNDTANKSLIAVLFSVVLILSFTIVFAVSVGQEGGRDRSSSMTRVMQAVVGVHLIAEKPLAGYGNGRAGYLLQEQTIVPEVKFYTNTIDNYFLSVAIDSGIIGFLFFMLFIGLPFFRILKLIRKRSDLLYDSSYIYLLLGYLGGVIVALVLSIYSALPLLFLTAGLLIQSEDNNQQHYVNSAINSNSACNKTAV